MKKIFIALVFALFVTTACSNVSSETATEKTSVEESNKKAEKKSKKKKKDKKAKETKETEEAKTEEESTSAAEDYSMTPEERKVYIERLMEDENLKSAFNLLETQRVGSEVTGYVDVPADFHPFIDVDYANSNMVQYSSVDTYNIVTLSYVGPVSSLNGTSNVEQVANMVYDMNESQGAKAVIGEAQVNSLWEKSVYVGGDYTEKSSMSLIFSPKDSDNVYILTVEGADRLEDVVIAVGDSWKLTE